VTNHSTQSKKNGRLNILVTGGSGFLGSHLAMFFLKEGHHVTILSSQKRISNNPFLRWIKMDLKDKKNLYSLKKEMDQADHCCFLAAEKPVPKKTKNILDTNRRIDDLSSDAFAECECESGIYLSGLSIYSGLFEESITERSFPHPLNDYTRSKLVGENMFKAKCECTKKKCRILRINAPYGPGNDPNHVIQQFLSNATRHKPLTVKGNGSRIQQFTWVGDCSRTIGILLFKDSGIFHFCGPERITMKDLAEYCVKVSESKSEIIYYGEETELSCPHFDLDRLEIDWPRVKRTDLKTGLALTVGSLKQSINLVDTLNI